MEHEDKHAVANGGLLSDGLGKYDDALQTAKATLCTSRSCEQQAFPAEPTGLRAQFRLSSRIPTRLVIR
jgi:hypothetical protein